MASGLSFWSSPPHPTSNPWQRPCDKFATPQNPSKHGWPSAFALTSPSPLRTSRNANLMSSPLHGGKIFGRAAVVSENDENTASSASISITPLPQTAQTNMMSTTSTSFTTPFPSAATSSSTPIFSFGSSNIPTTSSETPQQAPPTHAQERATQFQFAARARSSSPSTLLQSHTRENRDSRKRVFLDRLRNRRDDVRSDRTGDQVLRMDFMRERQEWEAEKARSQADDMLDVDDVLREAEAEREPEPQEPGPSPTDTNYEEDIEELTRSYYSHLNHPQPIVTADQVRTETQHSDTATAGTSDEMDVTEDFSDDGYDEAFMEFLSQDSTALRTGTSTGSDLDRTRTTSNTNNPDSEMDIS